MREKGKIHSVGRSELRKKVASDPNTIKELLADDFVAHIPTGPTDREGFVVHNNSFVKSFSDRKFIIEDLIAEGEKVVARATWQGVHSADFRGIPPTGKLIKVGATLIERLKDGKLVEHWSLFDNLGLMQQLGLVP